MELVVSGDILLDISTGIKSAGEKLDGLKRIEGNWRFLTNGVSYAANPTNLPLLVDLGMPAGGKLWAVKGITLFANEPWSQAPIANVYAAAYNGKLGTAGAQVSDKAACVLPGLSIPSYQSIPGTGCLVRGQQDHLYVLIGGTGLTVAGTIVVNAAVLEMDNSAASVPLL